MKRAESRRANVHAHAANSIFVTGTGTGVGKTVLSRWLIVRLIQHGVPVRAFKPLCSGGREDAQSLWRAQGRRVPLDVVNPWSFTLPVTPLVAARAAGTRIELSQVLHHIHRHTPQQVVLLVEGAGGLLSPLGEDFSSRELIQKLTAQVVVVAVNRLGVLNEVLLTWEALPAATRDAAHWVLFDPPTPDASTESNVEILAARMDSNHFHRLPRVTDPSLRTPRGGLARKIDSLLSALDVLPRESVSP